MNPHPIVTEVERRLSVVEEIGSGRLSQSPARRPPSPIHPPKSIQGRVDTKQRMIGPATQKREVGMLDGTPEKRLYWSIIEDSANLPDPDVLAQEIVDDLEAALEQFATIAEDLKK